MSIQRVTTIFFSPTGTSKKVGNAIAAGIGGEAAIVDLTYPGYSGDFSAGENELAVVAIPVYAGRLPALAVERLQRVKGNGQPAVAVVLYGNREYEDALIELRDLLVDKGFTVVAGAAFIGEHSFSCEEYPIAASRPDEEDLENAKVFGAQIAQTVAGFTGGTLQVPGDTPYKEGMKNLPFTPAVEAETCTLCEICVPSCPAGAISIEEEKIVMNAETCILCCACIKNCPEGAVSLTAPPLQEKVVALNKDCSLRKEPVTFL